MNLNYEEKTKIERPGREIKLDNALLGNKNVTVRIGSTDNKNCPQTVYIIITFWVDIKNKDRKLTMLNFDQYISKEYTKEIKKIKKTYLHDLLIANPLFPFYYENTFTFDFPENINYNDKRSFTTLELSLHTINCNREVALNTPYSLKNNSSCVLYNEIIKIAKVICQTDLLKGKLDFKIYKTKK